jgi:hypothetical protein
VRVYKSSTRQEAVPVNGVYKCFPKSENERRLAREFTSLEDAAAFLCSNPTWGIRMQPGSAIIYRDIVIERDG